MLGTSFVGHECPDERADPPEEGYVHRRPDKPFERTVRTEARAAANACHGWWPTENRVRPPVGTSRPQAAPSIYLPLAARKDVPLSTAGRTLSALQIDSTHESSLLSFRADYLVPKPK